MARFSISGGDDGEGSSNHQPRKRQRLPSIDEDEETAGSSGEEDEEEDDRLIESTSDDSDREVVIEEATTRQISSSRDSSLSVTLLDPDVLDCPICCEPLKLPIFQVFFLLISFLILLCNCNNSFVLCFSVIMVI